MLNDTLRNKFDSILDMNNIIKETIKTKKAIVDDISLLKNNLLKDKDLIFSIREWL